MEKNEAMNEEIRLLIKKNLPAETGDVLKQVLEQAEKDAKAVVALEGLNRECAKQIDSLKSKIREYERFDTRNSNLDAREKDVNSKEINLRIKELEYQLNAESDKTQFAKDVALGLVRNTEYKRTVFSNESSTDGTTGEYDNLVYKNRNSDSTKTDTAE